jgi:hypothetical protein
MIYHIVIYVKRCCCFFVNDYVSFFYAMKCDMIAKEYSFIGKATGTWMTFYPASMSNSGRP